MSTYFTYNDNPLKININDNLTFNEFKKLIEEKGLKKDYPDINQ